MGKITKLTAAATTATTTNYMTRMVNVCSLLQATKTSNEKKVSTIIIAVTIVGIIGKKILKMTRPQRSMPKRMTKRKTVKNSKKNCNKVNFIKGPMLCLT